MAKPAQHWKEKPEKHDFPAAADYLALVLTDAEVASVLKKLSTATNTKKKAKDLLRASGLTLLPRDNPHVADNLKKVSKGQKLSPVLLVRGDLGLGVPLTIADGYHRVSASYYLDEDADIPCRLVDLT
ncbi:MAG TPA: hypothetical protein VGG90_02085 [Candidatus Dormibacteraeota bacterium]|jgi:hypothetical protein